VNFDEQFLNLLQLSASTPPRPSSEAPETSPRTETHSSARSSAFKTRNSTSCESRRRMELLVNCDKNSQLSKQLISLLTAQNDTRKLHYPTFPYEVERKNCKRIKDENKKEIKSEICCWDFRCFSGSIRVRGEKRLEEDCFCHHQTHQENERKTSLTMVERVFGLLFDQTRVTMTTICMCRLTYEQLKMKS
jgi:hypothetical protein